MSVTAEAAPDVQANLSLWNDITAGYSPRDFAVRFWDGTAIDADPGQPTRFTLVLEHAGALRKMFWPFNKVGLGEAYIYGDFDVDGDLFAFMALLKFLIAKKFSVSQRLAMLKKLWRLPKDGRPRVGLQAANLSGPAQSAAQRGRRSPITTICPTSFSLCGSIRGLFTAVLTSRPKRTTSRRPRSRSSTTSARSCD